MGDSGPDHPDRGLNTVKTRGIVYGRLRFALKLLGRKRFRFLVTYGLEDAVHFFGALIRGRWSRAGAYLAAWRQIIRDLPALQAERRRVQAQRVLSDRELFALQRDTPQTLIWKGLPVLTRDLIDHHYAPLLSKKPPRRDRKRNDMKPTLLIISHDLVDTKMAGPGIRYLEMARALNRLGVEVTLAIPGQTGLTNAGVALVPYDEKRAGDLRTLSEKNEVIVISGYLINKFPFLETSRSRLVVDLYDPLVLENLHYYQKEPLKTQETLHRRTIELTNTLARIGDFFICGNERQRDFWLGLLTANRRINPLTFDQDPSLRRLIDQVGIGLPDRGPEPRPFLRGIHPLIPPSARIVLWGGGIWNWLDPLTLIEAWPRVTARHPEARLVFLGTRHPNPLVPVHEMARRAEQKAREIGEKDRTILFFDWLSYQDRESLLTEADIGVTLHPVHVETRYSLRTRVLDYIWANLPILITEGDVTSEWVREYHLGETVAPFNAGEAAEGLLRLLGKPKDHWTANFAPLQARLSWTTVAEPLLRYCLEGSYAPDRLDRSKNLDLDPPQELGSLARAAMIWRHEGFQALVYRGWRYLQARLSRI